MRFLPLLSNHPNKTFSFAETQKSLEKISYSPIHPITKVFDSTLCSTITQSHENGANSISFPSKISPKNTTTMSCKKTVESVDGWKNQSLALLGLKTLGIGVPALLLAYYGLDKYSNPKGIGFDDPLIPMIPVSALKPCFPNKINDSSLPISELDIASGSTLTPPSFDEASSKGFFSKNFTKISFLDFDRLNDLENISKQEKLYNYKSTIEDYKWSSKDILLGNAFLITALWNKLGKKRKILIPPTQPPPPFLKEEKKYEIKWDCFLEELKKESIFSPNLAKKSEEMIFLKALKYPNSFGLGKQELFQSWLCRLFENIYDGNLKEELVDLEKNIGFFNALLVLVRSYQLALHSEEDKIENLAPMLENLLKKLLGKHWSKQDSQSQINFSYLNNLNFNLNDITPSFLASLEFREDLRISKRFTRNSI